MERRIESEDWSAVLKDDGKVVVYYRVHSVVLDPSLVEAIVSLKEPTECGSCERPFTGDNPPSKLVCETCLEKARKIETHEEYVAACAQLNESIKKDAEEKAVIAKGPNPPLALPKGKYAVVDPCYVTLIEERGYYDRICEITCGPEGHGYIEVEGKPVFAFTTAHGDGCYPVYSGGVEVGKSGVDSGQLAFVPVELLEQGCAERDPSTVTLTRNSTVEQVRRGDYTAGSISVYTSGDDPYEDDDEDEFPHGQCDNCGGALDWDDDFLCEDCKDNEEEDDDDD